MCFLILLIILSIYNTHSDAIQQKEFPKCNLSKNLFLLYLIKNSSLLQVPIIRTIVRITVKDYFLNTLKINILNGCLQYFFKQVNQKFKLLNFKFKLSILPERLYKFIEFTLEIIIIFTDLLEYLFCLLFVSEFLLDDR